MGQVIGKHIPEVSVNKTGWKQTLIFKTTSSIPYENRGNPKFLIKVHPLSTAHLFTNTLVDWQQGIKVESGAKWNWLLSRMNWRGGPTPQHLPHNQFNLFHMKLHNNTRQYLEICKDGVNHRWEFPILHYQRIMVIYPYPFLVVITQLLSCMISINDFIRI